MRVIKTLALFAVSIAQTRFGGTRLLVAGFRAPVVAAKPVPWLGASLARLAG